jgi:hypothetical protein
MEPFLCFFGLVTAAVNQIIIKNLNSIEEIKHIYVLSGLIHLAMFAMFGAKLTK